MSTNTIKLYKNGNTYTIRFDEYGDIDTISRGHVNLSTTDREVMKILNNQDKLERMIPFAGFTYF